MSFRLLVTAGLTGLALAAHGSALADTENTEIDDLDLPTGDETVIDEPSPSAEDKAPPEPAVGHPCDPEMDVEPVDVDGLLLECDIADAQWVLFEEETPEDEDTEGENDEPSEQEDTHEDDPETGGDENSDNEADEGEESLPEDQNPEEIPADESPHTECDENTEGTTEDGATCVCVGDSYNWYYGSWYYDSGTWYFHHNNYYWYFTNGSWAKTDGDIAQRPQDSGTMPALVADSERDWYLPVTGPALTTLLGVAVALTGLGAATWWLTRRRTGRVAE